MDRLTSMAVFAKAVEAGSFTAAGDALSMSSQLVGKHVRLLEDYLGIKLLIRTTRRHRLTDAGQDFYERVQHILAEVEAAQALAERSRAVPRGKLRVNAPVTYGAHALSKIIPGYLAQFPEVSLDLTLTDRKVDLIDEGFDAAIRIGQVTDTNLVARQLRPYQLTLCAAPAYLERHGTPGTPHDLERHMCLGFASGELATEWRLQGPDGLVVIPIASRFVVNSGQALRTAAVAGLGLILQWTDLLAEDIASKRLVRLLPSYEAVPRPVYILYAPDRRMTPKLRSFVDFLTANLGPIIA